MKKIYLIIPVMVFALSCDRQRVFEEFTTLKGQSWTKNDILHYNVNIADSTRAYNVYISVRNTNKYEFSNLYLFITAHAPNGNSVRDTLEITLADDRGKWLGKGAASVYTLYHPYRQNIRFSLPGIYTFDIEQAMWVKDLKYINDIGLRVEKADESR